EAVRAGLDRTGAVITTGGLGPTSDDLTKPSIAALFGRRMRMDEAILDALKARWKARGWPGGFPKSNEQQALIPEGATILANNHGTAPGIWLEDERGRWVAMLPGVPREMRGMLADTLMPLVARRAGVAGEAPVVRSRTLRTTGIGESNLADLLGDAARGPEGMPLAYLPGWEGVDLRLTARGLPAREADAALDRGAAMLREKAGRWIYGEGATDLAAVVLEECRAGRLTIAVAESCTGGMLGARLTAIPGSSDVVLGGVIAYANAVKVAQLGVSQATLDAHGAVSEETVREMASGARARFGASAGIAITGVAGPGGGTPEKPVGTVWLGVDGEGRVEARRINTVGDREEIRRRATQAALALVRRVIHGEQP
ncbi:MAG TPA: CinA family nicotinamide mononucleotide deamidase-related protein, partial [Gemmatimonadaceae bacterium]|nr:CinA family nicotinamide mononucleotide deamidase-related protein [Gemmatimonadaceae bacterium]